MSLVMIKADPLKIRPIDPIPALVLGFEGFISKLSANYRLLITQHWQRKPNLHLTTNPFRKNSGATPEMQNYRKAWLPDRLGIIVNVIYRKETRL